MEGDYPNFFIFGHRWATKYLWIQIIDLPRERGYLSFDNMIKAGHNEFKIYSGTTPTKIIGGSPSLNYYSEDFIKFLEHHGANLKKWPIKIILSVKSKKKVKQPIPKYYYVEPIKYVHDITAIGGKGEIALFINEKGKFTTSGRKGLYFDLKEWDGEDFFGIVGTQLIIVTKKLKEVIEKAKLKNVKFENVEDYKW